MTTTRREFIRLGVVAGSAFAIGWDVVSSADDAKPFTPNGWIEIDANDRVTLTIGKSEMGQGIRTALPMILAEELGAEWANVHFRQASPSERYQGLGTGGSWSVRGSWTRLRTAGAAAREMLTTAAAAKLNVDAATLRAQNGFVIHDASGRRVRFGELVADAAKLEPPQKPALKSNDTFNIIGKRTKRIDAPVIVTGKAIYGMDARVDDMHYATIVRPPVLGGTITSFRSAAAKLPPSTQFVRVPSGIAIIAKDSWSALKARESLKIETDDGPHKDFTTEQHFTILSEAAKTEGVTLRKDGDPATAFANAAKTITARYLYPFYAHAPVEPMNCTVAIKGDTCEIWSPTQAPNAVQDRVAKLLNIPPANVKVNVTLLGGGFGRRLGWDYDLEAVEVARASGKPVKLFWTRGDDMQHGYFQAASLHDLSAAIDANGNITAWRHKKVSTPHNARAKATPEQLRDPAHLRSGAAWGVFDLPYGVPAVETAYVPLETHVPIGPWRAVFAPSSIFARECFLDELAHALKKDPFQLRVDLLNNIDDTFKAGDLTIDRRRARRVMQVLREKSQWDKPLPAGRFRGVAFSIYDGEIHVGYVAEIVLRGNRVIVDRVVCAIDCGLVVNPLGVEAQVESGVVWGLSSALKGEITFANGRAEQSTFGDFDVLRIDETPRIETHIVPSGSEPFGVGEPTVPPIVPAVLNAVFAATGKRIRRIPMRPEDLA